MGEYVKKDLLDELKDKAIAVTVLTVIQSNKHKTEYILILEKLLGFLQILLSAGLKMKLQVKVFIDYWRILNIESTNDKEK